MQQKQLSIIVTALIAASFSAAASNVHQHDSGEWCGADHPSVKAQSPLANMTVNDWIAKARSERQASMLKAASSVFAQSANNQADTFNYIDVTVFFPVQAVENYAGLYNVDDNGKPIENGAQFMLTRIEDKIAFFNDMLESQNVDARLRLAYAAPLYDSFAVVTNRNESESDNHVPDWSVFSAFSSCTNQREEWRSIVLGDGSVVECNNLNSEMSSIVTIMEQVGSDTPVYFRDMSAEGLNYQPYGNFNDEIGGVAGFQRFAAVYDEYLPVQDFLFNNPDSSVSENILSRSTFNHPVFAHEIGHFFGANHSKTQSDNPAPSDTPYAGYFCGFYQDPEGFFEPVQMGTIMTSASYQHFIFSDEDITKDGEACGVRGDANNIDIVRDIAPLSAHINEPVNKVADIRFEEASFTALSNSGTHTVRLTRSGDLSEPTSVSLIARDDSAWEQRDFNFGWQHVHFAAGQDKAEFTFTLIEQDKAHLDSSFTVQALFASNANITGSPMTVNIQSTQEPVVGSVGFKDTSVDLREDAGNVTVTIERITGSDYDVSFTVSTTDGTAKAGTDYTVISEVVELADGQTSATVTIPVTNRTGYQGDRSFTLNISSASNGLDTHNTSMTVNIEETSEEPATFLPTPPPAPEAESSGGSMGWGMLFLSAALLRLRRSK